MGNSDRYHHHYCYDNHPYEHDNAREDESVGGGGGQQHPQEEEQEQEYDEDEENDTSDSTLSEDESGAGGGGQQPQQEEEQEQEYYEEEEYDASDITLSDDHELDEEDTSMEITAGERALALAIKAAVEGREDFHHLSDMEYAQHAISLPRGEDNIALALQRIECLQEFRTEYKVDNTPSQGVYYLDRLMTLQPRAIVNVDICHVTGEGILVFNRGAIFPEIALRCSPDDACIEENWRIHAIASYYLVHAVNPSLESIREGAFFLWDGHEMSWKNISSAYTSRIMAELWMNYPFKVKKMMEYNTNWAASIFWSLIKPLLPRQWTQVMKFGCQVETLSNVRTLSELYLQPDLEQAKGHLLQRVHELLSLRVVNESEFRL